MKKELLAIVLLISILIACIINIRSVEDLTRRLAAIADNAEEHSACGSWDEAEKDINEAFALLESRSMYTGIVLSIDDIDEITDSLDLIMGHIKSRSPERVSAAVHLTKVRLDSIKTREQVSWSSVF